MAEILIGQVLEVDKLVSFRGKIRNDQIKQIGKEMEIEITKCGGKNMGYPITATFGIEGNYLDIELLIPVDKELVNIPIYTYKPKLRIENAIVAKHVGNPMKLQDTCNELNHYIIENKLTPITVGYNITAKGNSLNIEDMKIDVYVGINPNIL